MILLQVIQVRDIQGTVGILPKIYLLAFKLPHILALSSVTTNINADISANMSIH